MPCSPRITATSEKLSPVSRPAGAGMIEMPPTARAPPLPPDARVRGAGLVGVGVPDERRAALAGRPAGQLGAERIVLRQRRRAERRHGVGQAGPPRGRILVEHAQDRRLDLRRALVAAARGSAAAARSTCACITVSVEPANGGTPVSSS